MSDNLVKRLRLNRSTLQMWLGEHLLEQYEKERTEAADRIEKLEAALRLIAQNDYGLQGMIEDGTDTPENKAEYYAGQVNRRRYVARKALEGKDD